MKEKNREARKSAKADPLVAATVAAVATLDAVITAEAQILAGAMKLSSPAQPETEAERLRHEAEVEEGFDNLPI